jgi:hypothetical protein
MVEVTEADKLATKQHQQRFLSETELLWQAFATHREAAAEAERDRIVAWLRDMQVGRSSDNYPAYFARLIEESQP